MFKLVGLLSVLSSSVFAVSGITTLAGRYDVNENSIPSKIYVDLAETEQVIDKNFYGAHLNSRTDVPSKSIMDELQLGRVRIGGNEFDGYNYKLDKFYHKAHGVEDTRGFKYIASKLNQYKMSGVFQINLLGIQPEFENGNYVVKNTFTARSAYEMIKELNGNLKLGIQDFSLGNEFEQWQENHSAVWSTPDEGISADEYIAKYIEFAIAIRKAQEEVNGNPNSIKIWGPEVTGSWMDWNTANFNKDCQWSDTVRGQVNCSYGNGAFDHFIPYFLHRLTLAEKDRTVNPRKYKLLDYFSIHYYPNFRTKIDDINSVIKGANGKQQVANILASTQVLNNPNFINTIDISSYRNFSPNILGRMNDWINAYYPKAKLAINEFAIDSDYRCVNSYHPIIRPLYLADVMGIASREKVSFFNNFILSSGVDVADPWTMLNNETEKTSIFYMYKLFSANFKGTVLNVDDNIGDEINGYATVSDRIVNLAVVNKEPKEKAVQIYFKKGHAVKKVATYLAPAWSTSMLKLNLKYGFNKGNPTFEINQYGAKEMGVTVDTSYAK